MLITKSFGDVNNPNIFIRHEKFAIFSRVAYLIDQAGNLLGKLPQKVFKSLKEKEFVSPNARFFQNGDFGIVANFTEQVKQQAILEAKSVKGVRLKRYLAFGTLILPLMDLIGCLFKYTASFNRTVAKHQQTIKRISNTEQSIKDAEKVIQAGKQIKILMQVFKGEDIPEAKHTKSDDEYMNVMTRYSKQALKSASHVYAHVIEDFFVLTEKYSRKSSNSYTSAQYILEKTPETDLFQAIPINAYKMQTHLKFYTQTWDYFRDRCDGTEIDQRCRQFIRDNMDEYLGLMESRIEESQKLKNLILTGRLCY